MRIFEFDYPLDSSRIAQYPSRRRNDARLLVLDRVTKTIAHARFGEIVKWLRKGDLLILNDSRVIPARLYATKRETGGKVELLLTREASKNRWSALVKGKVKTGAVLDMESGASARVVDAAGDGRIDLEFVMRGDIRRKLHRIGHVPLPPYIRRPDEPGDRRRYQTVYAAADGSVAAPTAGLHFTRSLLAKLREKGVEIATVTLHVGPGTFKPVETEEIDRHKMDPEYGIVGPSVARAVEISRESGGRVIAVGSTSARVLEFAARPDGRIEPTSGWIDLYIRPGYRFKIVDGWITNFHLPRTTLYIMMCAFAGIEQTRRAYAEALECGYRFYSYGDAMFILPRGGYAAPTGKIRLTTWEGA